MFEKMPQMNSSKKEEVKEEVTKEIEEVKAPEMVIDPSSGLYTEKSNLENNNA